MKQKGKKMYGQSARFRCLSIALLVFSSMLVTPSFAKGPKIAVADNLAALLKSKPAKVKLEALKKELDQDKAEIERLDDDLDSLSKRLETDGDVMSSAQQEKLLKDIEDKNLDRNFLVKKYQKRQQEGQQEIVKVMRPDFLEAVKKVVEDGGYDVVIHKQALVYAGTAYDITEDITKTMDKQVD